MELAYIRDLKSRARKGLGDRGPSTAPVCGYNICASVIFSEWQLYPVIRTQNIEAFDTER